VYANIYEGITTCDALYATINISVPYSVTLENPTTEQRRCIGYIMLIGHFPQENPLISGSFAERDLQLKASDASSPPRTGTLCLKRPHRETWGAGVKKPPDSDTN